MRGPAAVVAVVAVLVGSAPAAAAPGRGVSCLLVTDARGDATAGPVAFARQRNEPAYDVVSADVAADGRTITAVVRVAQLRRTSGSAPTGMHWRLDFRVSGSSAQLYLQAFRTPFGERYEAGYVTGTSNTIRGRVTGVLDLRRHEVRVSAPAALFRPHAYVAPGVTIHGLRAAAGRFYSATGRHPSISERTDEARSARQYTVGTRSCVRLGR